MTKPSVLPSWMSAIRTGPWQVRLAQLRSADHLLQADNKPGAQGAFEARRALSQLCAIPCIVQAARWE